MLKKLRKTKKMTQKEVAELVGMSLRSYKSYENDENKKNTFKYNFIMEQLSKINFVDEEHGVLELEEIILICKEVLDKYQVDFCYLFGSYAKGEATPTSDIDLFISSNVSGLRFYGLVEELRLNLHKKVDVLDFNQLNGNMELTKEILKDGIKIYV